MPPVPATTAGAESAGAESAAPALSTPGARALCRAIRLLRSETAAAKASGALVMSADDLLQPAGGVVEWVDSLRAAAVTADGDLVPLPPREPWALQHLVYAVSAVLAWADDLAADDRLPTPLDVDALRAWSVVESLAGMPGRTGALLRAATARATAVPCDDSDPRPAVRRHAVRLPAAEPAVTAS